MKLATITTTAAIHRVEDKCTDPSARAFVSSVLYTAVDALALAGVRLGVEVNDDLAEVAAEVIAVLLAAESEVSEEANEYDRLARDWPALHQALVKLGRVTGQVK